MMKKVCRIQLSPPKVNKDIMKYEDIIHLPHHRSKKHPPMPIIDRAAQFSPFAALTGHQELIRETQRKAEEKYR